MIEIDPNNVTLFHIKYLRIMLQKWHCTGATFSFAWPSSDVSNAVPLT